MNSLTILLILVLQVLANLEDLQNKIVEGHIQLTKDLAYKLYKEKFHRQETIESDNFKIFHENLSEIVQINLNKNNTWKAGINKFSFMSKKQFQELNPIGIGQNCSATVQQQLDNFDNFSQKEFFHNQDLPSHFDWREFGIVTHVKDQMSCGSCWTFSTTGAMESHWALYTQQSPSIFSEQQLLDCAGDFDNNGCKGGLPSHAFEYMKYSGGIGTENQYPYFGIELFQCKYDDKTMRGAFAKGGSFNITYKDENQIQEQLYKKGPISVAYRVQEDFQHYQSGIYNSPNCPQEPEDVNHAVLAVGWGQEGDTKYWIIKNSWSNKWGEDGYFKMVMGQNMCGIADCASYPIIGEPQQ